MDNVWLVFHQLCNKVDLLLKDKANLALDLPSKCTSAHSFVSDNSGQIMIIVGLLLIIVSVTSMLKKLNNRLRTFESTLLDIKVITHDTKVFTFDLPKGWNMVPLKIG